MKILKKYLYDNRISYKDIRQHINTTDATLSRMLNGKRKIRLDETMKFCRMLKMDFTLFHLQMKLNARIWNLTF